MLEKKIRNQALAASKRKDNIERDIMRLALKEIFTKFIVGETLKGNV